MKCTEHEKIAGLRRIPQIIHNLSTYALFEPCKSNLLQKRKKFIDNFYYWVPVIS